MTKATQTVRNRQISIVSGALQMKMQVITLPTPPIESAGAGSARKIKLNRDDGVTQANEFDRRLARMQNEKTITIEENSRTMIVLRPVNM